MIKYNKQNKTFSLNNGIVSYNFMVEEQNILAHLHFGAPVDDPSVAKYGRFWRNQPALGERGQQDLTLDTLLQEYPGNGLGDFREPSHLIQQKDGTHVTDFRFDSYEIVNDKKKIPNLPTSFAGGQKCQTLIIKMVDSVANINVYLSYSIFESYSLITRSIKFENNSDVNINIKRAFSASIDFANRDFDVINLNGYWGREKHVEREQLTRGIRRYDSKRGFSSSQMHPFVAIADRNADENKGEVWGFGLVYSGNHAVIVEKDSMKQTRVAIGLNDFNFNWILKSKEEFNTPEVLMVYSNNGIGEMSRTFHKFIVNNLMTSKYAKEERPILINNWEGTYFDFDQDKIFNIASKAKEIGIELMVLDDGWFGGRVSNDRAGLGDWFVNENKLKGGLKKLVDKVHDLGMKFGLWFEPEMVNEDSDLLRKHPDYCYQIPGRTKSIERWQYVLDFSRQEVVDNIYEQMVKVLDDANLDYIKWDMNRNWTDAWSKILPAEQQGEVNHRYIIGLYNLIERLSKRYPNILFENCASGGGRYDLGMTYYMPQTWASDNSDAIARLKIQEGTSYIYPSCSMTSHVSVTPNHQNGRVTPLETRGVVASWGSLGYELDLTKLTDEELQISKKQIEFYKEHRKLIQFGELYRLESAFNSYNPEFVTWMIVSEDKSEALLYIVNILAIGMQGQPMEFIKLKGLNSKYNYEMIREIKKTPTKDVRETNFISANYSDQFEKVITNWSGNDLMNSGFYWMIPNLADFQSELIYFKRKK